MNTEDQKIKVLIVDDEKKACTNLKNILVEYVDPELNIVSFAHNTADAEKKITQLYPDAIFLDIEMPNENAFQFLERIAPVDFEVVFVTSYDEYAIRAFKLNAVDYILKPISIHELKDATQKLKEKIKYKRSWIERQSFYKEISNQVYNKEPHHKIVLKDNNTTEVIDFRDIYFIEAQSSYSKIIFLKNSTPHEIIMSNPLSNYEELLPPDMFYRIHRSYLVNCSLIKKILRNDINKVVLQDDFLLPISRRRYAALLSFLKSNRHYHE